MLPHRWETRSNGDLVMRVLGGVQILIYRADIHRIKETCGVRKPSPAGKVARRIAETDEEVTNQQITRLSEKFVERVVSAKM